MGVFIRVQGMQLRRAYLDPNLTHIYTAKPPRGAHPGHLTREKSNKWNQSDFTILSGDQFENTFDKTYSREIKQMQREQTLHLDPNLTHKEEKEPTPRTSDFRRSCEQSWIVPNAETFPETKLDC